MLSFASKKVKSFWMASRIYTGTNTLRRFVTQQDDDVDYNELETVSVQFCRTPPFAKPRFAMESKFKDRKLPLHMNHLKVYAEREYDTFRKLEFLEKGEWKPLVDVTQLRSESRVYLRDPLRWCDDDSLSSWMEVMSNNVDDGEAIDAGYIKLHYCFIAAELEECEDYLSDELYKPRDLVRFNMNHIKVDAEQWYGSAKDLEYFDGKQWKPMLGKDINIFSKFRRVDERFRYMPELYVRLPSRFRERDGDEQVYGRILARSVRKDAEVDPMERMIYDLGRQIIAEERGGNSFWNEGGVRDWVELQAETDSRLLSLLLSRVGALDHIVTSLRLQAVRNVVQHQLAFKEFE
jgi:hypothetical protein